MIRRAEWFTYRKFGWGLTPRTWQGWLYVAVIAVVLGAMGAAAFNHAISIWIYIAVVALILADIIYIMSQLPKTHDERENYHQLLIERNCSFAAIGALIIVALYQSYWNLGKVPPGNLPFDISIIVVLMVMAVTKLISTLYLQTKM